MNAHPVLGAEIIAPVRGWRRRCPMIRHHHEWYNGSGYPDRLIGDEIPRLARILHVADAFEAMTAARPYRMTPLTHEQAMDELRKYAGIQFDPVVVDAFSKTPGPRACRIRAGDATPGRSRSCPGRGHGSPRRGRRRDFASSTAPATIRSEPSPLSTGTKAG